MSTALVLPFPDLAPVARQETHADTAAAFLEANPELRRWLIFQALEHDRIGIKVGIKFLVESARVKHHKLQMHRSTQSPWLIDNSWTAYFARILMAEEPRLAGYFTTRQAKHETAA